jgi:hypothetical protein
MSAVVGVLTENITESIKGFYKLRKANITLESILQEEKKYIESLEDKGGRRITLETDDPAGLSSTLMNELKLQSKETDTPDETVKADSESEEFYDVAEDVEHLSDIPTPAAEKELNDSMNNTTLNGASSSPQRQPSHIQDGPDAALFTDFHDEFIHSSSNMCYGMLLIMISMLPPAFSTLSKIVGFKGDRRRGIELLWQASKFGNLNGAFAGLVLLGYYNGFIGFCDILPQSGAGAFPKERCRALLRDFRTRYPKVCQPLCLNESSSNGHQSCLWMLEEARMVSSDKELANAVSMLETMPNSKLKQVMALQCFEKSMNCMFLHRYEPCSESFQKMVGLNNWSHGLYYYIAACCHVERYRELALTEPENAVSSLVYAV